MEEAEYSAPLVAAFGFICTQLLTPSGSLNCNKISIPSFSFALHCYVILYAAYTYIPVASNGISIELKQVFFSFLIVVFLYFFIIHHIVAFFVTHTVKYPVVDFRLGAKLFLCGRTC